MKYSIKFFFNLLIISMLSIGLFSCDTEEQEISITPNSSQSEPSTTSKNIQSLNEVHLEIIKGAIIIETQGLAAEAIEAAIIAYNQTEDFQCGDYDEMSNESNYSDSDVTSNYTSSFNWMLVCTPNQVPSFLNYNRFTSGTYETKFLSSVDDSESTLKIQGITETDDAYEITGRYLRTGVQELNPPYSGSYDSNISIRINDLFVDKSTFEILSGSANLILTGTSNGGTPYAFTAGVSLNGDGTVTIEVMNQSHTFEL